jgi:peptidylprolyl isomerase
VILDFSFPSDRNPWAFCQIFCSVGKKYLEENKDKEGVVQTASGLQYKVLESGKGKTKPSKSDTVKVHYR